MWMDRSFFQAIDDIVVVFSGDYHFCILLSDSFIAIYALSSLFLSTLPDID